jgi:homoserine kinase
VKKVRVRAPATLSNLGPGFDVLGLALDGPYDAVEAEVRDQPGLSLAAAGPFGDRIPLDPAQNVAAYAASRVVGDRGLHLRIEKQIPPGSGLGSSAASSVAAAVAAARAYGLPATPELLLPIVRDAEALAAGSAHLDNVAPALLGGFVGVVGQDPPEVRRLTFPEGWWLAVVLPAHPVATKEARAILPDHIPRGDAVANLRALTGLLDAAARADLGAFARHLVDRVAYPYRRPLWPFLPAAEAAALGAGALALVDLRFGAGDVWPHRRPGPSPGDHPGGGRSLGVRGVRGHRLRLSGRDRGPRRSVIGPHEALASARKKA